MSILDGVPDVPPCDSPIWGHGELLDAVQRAHLFPDSKTFVDLKLKHKPDKIVARFKELPGYPSPKKKDLKQFILDNFCMDQNLEFEEWDPSDWVDKPPYLKQLKQKPLVYVGHEVNKLWKILSQKCSQDLQDHPELYSKINLPHGFIMPGGRFREIYYWDTYWIIRGLLVSDMHETVKGVLENFLYQIRTFGHIPNGTRIYYQRRTQPPFLLSMISKYVEKTGDLKFVQDNLELIERELDFYHKNRRLKYKFGDKTFTVFRYFADCRGPRPESYAEDVEAAESIFQSDEDKEEFYLHMKAAAESGWDFSSRWFINDKGGNTGTIVNAKTAYILPVDLNALMYKNYAHMVDFCNRLGLQEKSGAYQALANDMMVSMNELFWDSSENMWFDVDMLNDKRRTHFYASNLFPLWAEAYPKNMREIMGKCAVDYLQRTAVTEHSGGIPASRQHTGQQWDWNAWPPLQHFIVSGLNKTGYIEAEKMAFKIARNYTLGTIKSCHRGKETCEIFEKYDPTNPGVAGGGGEYEVQLGFGWTNGVLLDFIMIYKDDIIETDELSPELAKSST